MVEDITEALRGSKVSPATISELNKKTYAYIEAWHNRPLQGGQYPYVYVDEVLGAAEGMKEDKASWVSFFQWLRGRGLDGVTLMVGGKCLDGVTLVVGASAWICWRLWERCSQRPNTSAVPSIFTAMCSPLSPVSR